MEMRTKCFLMVVGILAGLLAVGCGGDGDDMSADLQRQFDMQKEELEAFRMAQMLRDQEEQARRDTMAAAGLEGGLARSPQAAVYATSEQDTVANLLPAGQTVFSPSSAALYWDFLGVRTVAQPELGAAHVKSFSSDGAGGFHVTYVIDGKEHPAHFTRNLYRPDSFDYLKRLEDNNAWLWSWSGAFEIEEDDHTDGSIYRDYHDVHGWEFVLGGCVNSWFFYLWPANYARESAHG